MCNKKAPVYVGVYLHKAQGKRINISLKLNANNGHVFLGRTRLNIIFKVPTEFYGLHIRKFFLSVVARKIRRKAVITP